MTAPDHDGLTITVKDGVAFVEADLDYCRMWGVGGLDVEATEPVAQTAKNIAEAA